jgi:hypothetical protein
MNTPNAGAGRRPRGFAREIATVLLIKLVLIIAIKFAFFSAPLDKREVAQRLGQMVDRTAGEQAPDGPRPNSVEQH